MLNILSRKALLDHFIIDEERVEVDMSFDNILRVAYIIEDEDASGEERVLLALYELIGKEQVYAWDYSMAEMADILKAMLTEIFLDNAEVDEDGKVVEWHKDIRGNWYSVEVTPEKAPPGEETEKTYSAYEDSELIYAAFMETYGIDLLEEQGKLHWFRFQALLKGLNNDTVFKKVVEARTAEIPSGKGTEKQAQTIRENKQKVRLKGKKPEW